MSPSSSKSEAKIWQMSVQEADGVVYNSLSAVITGKPVYRVAGPDIAYQANWHFMSDDEAFTAIAFPAQGKTTNDTNVVGFTFEVRYSGSYLLAAPITASQVQKELIREATQIVTPVNCVSVQKTRIAPHERLNPSPNGGNGNNNSSPIASGTGFFITDDGYLISNNHVVKGAAKVRLLTGTGLIDATVVKVDAVNDLALLKAVGTFAPLPIAASRTVKLGGTVATVGFPDIGLQGFAPKLAKGEIASLAGAADDPRYFQVSLPLQPGNSGGALVDTRGNVVGIVAAKLDASVALAATGALPENVNYAVKSSLLLSFLESAPDIAAKLKEPNTKDEAFEDVVKSAQDAAVLVLVY